MNFWIFEIQINWAEMNLDYWLTLKFEFLTVFYKLKFEISRNVTDFSPLSKGTESKLIGHIKKILRY